MSMESPELRASHADRDRCVEVLRIAGGDGLLAADELDSRLERALTARTRAELAALVADLPPPSAAREVLVVEQTGGRWSRSGSWSVPDRIEVRTTSCRVTLDFTDAITTSKTLVIETEMAFGKLVLIGAPGLVIDTDGLNRTYSTVKRRGAIPVVTDPRLRIELTGTLKHTRVRERWP